MSSLYKQMVKQNNNQLKKFTGEYKINCESFIKEIRSYAMEIQSTEKVIADMLEELSIAYDKNIRFTNVVSNKEEYLKELKGKCLKGVEKTKFTLKQKFGIAAFIIIMVGVTVLGIILKQPVNFDEPTNLSINETTLIFDKVEYAEKYIIIITDLNDNTIAQKETKDNSIDLSKITEISKTGTYKIRVKVKETNIMEESDWSEYITYSYTSKE